MNLVLKALRFGAFLLFSCSFIASAPKKPALAIATNEQIDQWESEALDELASLQDPAAQNDMAELLSISVPDQSQSPAAVAQTAPAEPVPATASAPAPVSAPTSLPSSNSPAIENKSAATSQEHITISLPPVKIGPIPAITPPVSVAPSLRSEGATPGAAVASAEPAPSAPEPYEQQFIPVPDASTSLRSEGATSGAAPAPAASIDSIPVVPVSDATAPAVSPNSTTDNSIMAALNDVISEDVASEEPEEAEEETPAEPGKALQERSGVVEPPVEASAEPDTTQNETVTAAVPDEVPQERSGVTDVEDKAESSVETAAEPGKVLQEHSGAPDQVAPDQTPLDEKQVSLKKRVEQEAVLAKKEKQAKPELLTLPLDFDFTEPLLGKIYDGKNAFVIPSEETDLIHKSGGNPTYGEITPQALRALLTDLQLDGKDVFYSLGSGSGKEVLYVALATPAKAVGVELSETRYNMAQSAKQTIQKAHNIYLGNKVRFINKNILQVHNIKRATVVYINNLGFSNRFMEQMAQKFKSLKDGATILAIGKELPERPFYQLKQVYNLPMSWASSTPVYRYEVLKKTIARRPVKNCPPSVQAA